MLSRRISPYISEELPLPPHSDGNWCSLDDVQIWHILPYSTVMPASPSEVTEGDGPQWRVQGEARGRLVVVGLLPRWYSGWGRWSRLEARGLVSFLQVQLVTREDRTLKMRLMVERWGGRASWLSCSHPWNTLSQCEPPPTA